MDISSTETAGAPIDPERPTTGPVDTGVFRSLALVAACLHDGPIYRERDTSPRGIARPVTGKPFVCGRNDPCPCKSGKKFKKCCGG